MGPQAKRVANGNASPSRHPCVAVTTQALSGSTGHGAGVGARVVGATVVEAGVVGAGVGAAGVVGAGVSGAGVSGAGVVCSGTGDAVVLTISAGSRAVVVTTAGSRTVVVASLFCGGAVLASLRGAAVVSLPPPQPARKRVGLTTSAAMAARATKLSDMAGT